MIKYEEYVAEQINKSIAYSEYVAEQINRNINFSEYLSGIYDTKNFKRKKKIKNLFK
jgi:hypothetical protein